MAFQTGFTLENHTISALERHHGFRLDTNSTWDHKYKIDFVVLSIPGFRLRATGVQITQRPKAYDKMSQFLAAQTTQRPIVDRALYIEVDPSVPLDEGGVDLVALALKNFQADRKLQTQNVLGVRIYDDMTYEFFDLAEDIRTSVDEKTQPAVVTKAASTARTEPAKQEIEIDGDALSRALLGDKSAGKEMRGVLNSYRPSRGFGMATGNDGNSYFVHIYSIVDPDLKERLARYSGETPVNLEMPIAFVDGGRTKEHVKYNEAKQVTSVR